MKGIVFTEFLELVESKYGLEMVDRIITNSKLNSKGIYTAIGTYEFSEMLELLTHLSTFTNISIDELLLIYAEHFFYVLKNNYPKLLKQYTAPLDLLASIEDHIHVEVIKIYPDAELPTFKIINQTETSLTLLYTSSRSMHHFGLGLMKETFVYFNQKAQIDLEKIKDDGTEVKFMIKTINA